MRKNDPPFCSLYTVDWRLESYFDKHYLKVRIIFVDNMYVDGEIDLKEVFTLTLNDTFGKFDHKIESIFQNIFEITIFSIKESIVAKNLKVDIVSKITDKFGNNFTTNDRGLNYQIVELHPFPVVDNET